MSYFWKDKHEFVGGIILKKGIQILYYISVLISALVAIFWGKDNFQQQRVACVLLRFVLVLVTGRCFYEHKGRYL